MRTLLLIMAAATTAAAGDFGEIDALLRRGAEAKIALANSREKFAEEARTLDAEISASEALRAELERRVAALEKRLAKSAENDAAAGEKIARDEKSFSEISKILDAHYARLSERLAAAKSGVFPLSKAEFAAKPPNEKFREFASLYARAAAADRAYSDEAGGVKTGIFLPASGAEREGGIVWLRAGGGAEGGK